MNALNSTDAEWQLGEPVFDRMRNKALAVFFDWSSYRHTLKLHE